ncbi:alpha/beta hydrolase [Kineococcus sp. SYSU DK002]|uniref:alpha/beta hydrolase n=1 Tax=Kineococcus sp. SYSU DK002 TaxID=3383123 RepID=UPI003D7E7DA5
MFAAPFVVEVPVFPLPFAPACRTAAVPVLALACLLAGLLGLGVAPPAAPAAAPVTTVPATGLADVYAQHRQAARTGPGRRFLTYDRAGRGLVTEVLGDLRSAPTVAVLVGGVGTDLATYERGTLRAGARALAAPGRAVVAWADYVSPASLGPDAAGPDLARTGGDRLRTFLDSLHAHTAATRVVLVCHSYGSAVCAAALADGRAHGVGDVVDLASPGVGDGDLPEGVRRWTATAPDDPIRFVPHVRLGGLGLGEDPAATPGARRLPVPADGGHDGYLVAGSPTLAAVQALLSA